MTSQFVKINTTVCLVAAKFHRLAQQVKNMLLTRIILLRVTKIKLVSTSSFIPVMEAFVIP